MCLQISPENKQSIVVDSAVTAFRPKAMSSPDFLKRYRNNEDWPELAEDGEEEGKINTFENYIRIIILERVNIRGVKKRYKIGNSISVF